MVNYNQVKSRAISGHSAVTTALMFIVLLSLRLAEADDDLSFRSALFSENVSAVDSATLENEPQYLLQAPPIHYLVYGSAAEPLQIIESNGVLRGFITDVVNEVFEPSNIAIKPVMKPIKRIKREMIQGQAKRWIAYALRSWKSEGVWDGASFATVDLLPYHLSLGYKKTSSNIELQHLSQQGVVWIQGFRYPGTKAFSDRYQFEFQRAKDHTAMLKMVEAGRVHYFMEHKPRMLHVMDKLGVDKSSYGFYSLHTQVPPTHITLLMSNDLGPEVIAFVNRRLTEMSLSGRIQELSHRYKLDS